MKFLNTLIVLFVVLQLLSCGGNYEDSVTFLTPQPIGSDDLEKFPPRFTGTYRSLADSSLLVVSKHNLISRMSYSARSTIHQLDSADRAEVISWGDTIVANPETPGSFYRIYGDSLELKINDIDTLFDIRNGDLLRKFRGYFFANVRYADETWKTIKITPTRQGLILSTISYSNEMEGLKELTIVKDDSLTHSYSPSRKQIKLFIRDKGFKNEEHYIKLD